MLLEPAVPEVDPLLPRNVTTQAGGFGDTQWTPPAANGPEGVPLDTFSTVDPWGPTPLTPI